MLNVEIFDEENEEDLEDEINNFLKELQDGAFVDLKYQISHFITKEGEQIFSYSALIIYKSNKY